MRVKAIQDLSQLTDGQLFKEIEEGALLCGKNAKRILNDSHALSVSSRFRGAEVLRLAAEEEASKVLILLDAVRCPRNARTGTFARQLQYFSDHLTKGIYAQYCGLRPAIFEDVRLWVNRERKEFYLDGPNGVDWIFYNDILRRREETTYVDYVENDGQHLWHDPAFYDDAGFHTGATSNPVLRIVDALCAAGLLRAPSLKIIADIWRPLTIDDSFSWRNVQDANIRTLESLDQANELADPGTDAHSIVVNEWLFPLYELDLRKDPVRQEDLREIQSQWTDYDA